MHFLTSTTLFTTLFAIRAAAQGIVFSQPAAGGSIATGAVALTVTDSGEAPALASLKTGRIDLCWGGNTATNSKCQEGVGSFAFPSTTTTANIPAAGAGGPITNGYYFRVTSATSDGGTVINYSGRFTVTGMGGVADAAFSSAAQAAAGVVPTATVSTVAAGATPAAAGGAFDVPYGEQVGLTKYAPMQPIPPTKITKRDSTMLNPTSAYVTATTFMPRPTILTTITQSQTFSVVSVENTAAPQSNPNSAMQRFLNRWKD